MLSTRQLTYRALSRFGHQYLPFADAATADVPLSRLLRLSLFQVTVGMAMVLLVGTLNRVMIVELDVSSSLVGIMIALPLAFAPFRTLIGYRSDTYSSALGLRRMPFIWKGTMLQFGGFAIMPFALLVLSGYGDAADAPRWIGQAAAALAFLLVGAGVHMVQTVGLALATDLVPEDQQPKVVGLMYVMLLLGMIVSAAVFGMLLQHYTPGRLVQVIQGAAVITVALNWAAMWKQEARDRVRAASTAPKPGFGESWSTLIATPGTLRLLVAIGLGTFGFGMSDVVLEPFGGQVLHMTIASTTKLTALLAFGGLIGFTLASRILGAGGNPLRVAMQGALVGVPAYAAMTLVAMSGSTALFAASVIAVGFGAGLFGHGTLTATMRAAPRDQTGLALGAWGAVQATAAGLGIALGGVVRDGVMSLSGAPPGSAMPYVVVFGTEVVFLLLALVVVLPLVRSGKGRRAAEV